MSDTSLEIPKSSFAERNAVLSLTKDIVDYFICHELVNCSESTPWRIYYSNSKSIHIYTNHKIDGINLNLHYFSDDKLVTKVNKKFEKISDIVKFLLHRAME